MAVRARSVGDTWWGREGGREGGNPYSRSSMQRNTGAGHWLGSQPR